MSDPIEVLAVELEAEWRTLEGEATAIATTPDQRIIDFEKLFRSLGKMEAKRDAVDALKSLPPMVPASELEGVLERGQTYLNGDFWRSEIQALINHHTTKEKPE